MTCFLSFSILITVENSRKIQRNNYNVYVTTITTCCYILKGRFQRKRKFLRKNGWPLNFQS